MRKKLIAGNWKMNTTAQETADLVALLSARLSGDDLPGIVVCPPFTSLATAVQATEGSVIKVGAQDMFWEDSGAFTGEISGKMLLTLGCSHVILGHSERREYFFETDGTVNSKLKKALSLCLTPIVCVGETLDQRDAGETENVVKSQILGAFDGIEGEDFQHVVVAYEPVWAIGTGKTATPEQAEEIHASIREILREKYGAVADDTQILYGGSMKPENAASLLEQPDIDGGLIGGASLKAESFLGIIDAARR